MFTLTESLRIVLAITNIERQKPLDQQSPAIAREARLCADVLIEKSTIQRAVKAALK